MPTQNVRDFMHHVALLASWGVRPVMNNKVRGLLTRKKRNGNGRPSFPAWMVQNQQAVRREPVYLFSDHNLNI